MSDAEYSSDVMNTALELVTEWGENYGKPIDERILGIYPQLTPDDIERLTELSREAEHYIYKFAESELDGGIGEHDIVPAARERYPWLNDSNAWRLKSIGMFYARK